MVRCPVARRVFINTKKVRWVKSQRKGVAMPLSEHEQRVLAELEESLSKEDPRFARNVRETTVYSHSGRRVRWGVVGFVAGLTILLLTFSSSIPLGLLGVAIMFASAILIERNARRLGRASWNDFTRTLRSEAATRPSMEDRRNSMREWLERRRRGE
jgi:hypothetical protein